MVSGDASGCASSRRRGTGESFTPTGELKRGHRRIEKVPQGNCLPPHRRISYGAESRSALMLRYGQQRS